MSRTDPVWMHHPDLDRTIQVVRSQVPHLGASGWIVSDPPPEPEPKPKSTPKPKPSRRPRPTSEKEST